MLIGLSLFSFGQKDKNVLLWSADRPLNWNDFNGKPEKRFAAASTHYDILKHLKKENANAATVTIEAVFFRHKSWKKVSWINDEVLAHEQRHFDIVELFARQLRKAVSAASYKSYEDLSKKLDEFYDKFDKAMDVYQDKYDEETDGSMNGDQQRAWQKKIAAELKELEAFKGTVLTLKLVTIVETSK
jgi:hypothetical protein